MRTLDDGRKQKILEFIDEFFDANQEQPSLREIAEGTNLAKTTVQRYLMAFNNDSSSDLSYYGRAGVKTPRMDMERAQRVMPVVGFVRCGPGEEEIQEIKEYIRMPVGLLGNPGDYFALIAKGESMIDAGIHPGDYVFVRKQITAAAGDIVVALHEGLSNLKRLAFTDGMCVLQSCNEDKDLYPDIPAPDLHIQGVAVGVYHSLEAK